MSESDLHPSQPIACTLNPIELATHRTELLAGLLSKAGPLWLEVTGPEGTQDFLPSCSAHPHPGPRRIGRAPKGKGQATCKCKPSASIAWQLSLKSRVVLPFGPGCALDVLSGGAWLELAVSCSSPSA